MSEENKLSSLDVWSAIQKMRDTQGWKLFLERYAKKGDVYLTDLLDVKLEDNGVKYTKRDLLVHQLEALGTLGQVLNEFELEAKNASEGNKQPKHIGV